MHSPSNKFDEQNMKSYYLIRNKIQKNKALKSQINNSKIMNKKKLIISRNNISEKNIFRKTNNYDSYKEILMSRQLSSNSSPTNADNKQNNTTTSIISNINNYYNNKNQNNSNANGQILISKKKEKKTHDSLYKYLIKKIKESNNENIFNKKNNNNSNLDFSIKLLKNENQNYIKKDDLAYKKINDKNIFRKLVNFPLSPINNSSKILKLNKFGDTSYKNIKNLNAKSNKDILNNNNIQYKKILSSRTNNSKKNLIYKIDSHNHFQNENSIIYKNTNNININLNIINKVIKNNKEKNNDDYLNKKNLINKDLIANYIKTRLINISKEKNKNKLKFHNNSSYFLCDKGQKNLNNISLNNSVFRINPFMSKVANNELFNSSNNKDNNNIFEKSKLIKINDKSIKMNGKSNFKNYPEEIHFRAIKYFQEIKKRNDQIYENYNK